MNDNRKQFFQEKKLFGSNEKKTTKIHNLQSE